MKEPVPKHPYHTFQEFEELYFSYIKSPEARAQVKKAYDFAKKAHEGQLRKSGEPYITHCIEVGYILAALNVGPSTLCAALLHDVVEDTNVPLSRIEEEFGADVGKIVDSLTKIQRLKLSHRDEDDFVAEDHRKIFLGMARDIRVIIIKLADRLHNMRTLDSLSLERQNALARETLSVFAPIAHRLGINRIKSELEDLSLKYLSRSKYEEITALVNARTKRGMKSLENLSKRIADILFEHGLPFQISYRVKSIYSIYRKIYEKGRNFDEIFDVLAIRIITETELNCYEILGLIHATYSPIPGRFKDYVAVPKPNMYQSLHTCIIAGDGNIFEVQIRTKEMDDVAEGGVAAHWRYKEGTNYNPREEQKEIEEQLHWFRDFINLSEEDYDAKGYMESLAKDIFEANVYVFTPKGKVIDLPNGATPLDFAYKIHTGVGDSAVGALVNNQMVPLNTVLKTGDVVEIKTSKTSTGPKEGWLQIAKTNFAKAHIRKMLTKRQSVLMRGENIARGKANCLEAFRLAEKNEAEMVRLLNDPKLLNNFHAQTLDDLYVLIAGRNPAPGAIIDWLGLKRRPDRYHIEKEKHDTDSTVPVYVKNAGRIAITLGQCCSPIPGDDIVGYVTKGKGVTVHRVSCPNVASGKARLIDVYWKDDLGLNAYPVDIRIEAGDRSNLLVDVMSVLSQNHIAVTAINAILHKETLTTTIEATIQVMDAKRLNDIFAVLKGVHSIYDVSRIIH